MIKHLLNFRKTCSFSERSDNIINKYAITLFFILIIIPNLYSQNYYYVSPNANGSGNGTTGNPWTIYQAAAIAKAGDVVLVDKGTYDLNAVLSFNNSGNATNPIVFRGVRADEDEKTAGGTNNTMLSQSNGIQAAISIGGNYVTLKNMILRENYPEYMVRISGSHVTLDSVVTQYPSNVSSGGNHTIQTSADYTTIRYCYLWQSPRTVVWVEPIYPNTCDHFLMEYTTISSFDNHYAIQLMPQTQSTPVPKVTNATIRNCTFTDGGYESSLYIRNVYNCKIYNNLFINSLGRYADLQLFITDGINVEPGYDAASIFANNTIYSTLVGGSGVKSASSILLMGDSNQNGWTVKNNICSVADGVLPYRYICNATSPAGQDFSIDYNLIYVWNKSVSSLSNTWPQVGSTSSSSYSWSSWQNSRGFDVHSIIDTDPGYINPTTNRSTANFRLQNNITGEDLSSWGITTDYNGNARDPNNPTLGAFEYSAGGGVDITPPRVMSASLINSTSLRITFSEPLAISGAENSSNYIINNGVSINSVSYSGNQATLQTTPHASGSYTVTVNNITDLAGNIISSSSNSAQYSYVGDTTPPSLLSASVLNPATIEITFSEALENNSALVKTNYSINNGIVVNSVTLSTDGKTVTLNTTTNVPNQTYTVVVNNVMDLAGNVISSSSNSAQYSYVDDTTPPNLLSALVLNPTTVELTFSEALENNSASLKTNYSINNGIVVNSVSFSADGKKVTLNTTTNAANQTYTVVVNNVKDLAGNTIAAQNNTATYIYQSTSNLLQLPINGVSASVISEPNHTPEKIIDGLGYNGGDPDSRWAGIPMPQWLVFDLGASKKISLLKLQFYNWDGGRIYTYSIQVSNDATQWNEVLSNASSTSQEWTQNSFSDLNARYLKLIFVSNNQNTWAGLWEAQVWGPNTSGSDLTPPNLLGATLTNSTSLVLNFSEPLSPSTTQNINNYSISNGINVTSASISGSQVILTTSEHSAGSYTVTVNNVTDLSGNVINPNSNSVQYSYTSNPPPPTDTTPPNLLNASVLNPTAIELGFSEALDNSSALNKFNYSINNGIVVDSVFLSSDAKKVTLSTTQNAANQTYTVVVNNVKDLAGNIISSNNTATYSFVDNTVGNLKANVKVYLEGPYQNGSMTTALYDNELLPSSQPYSAAPWLYNGNESFSSSPSTTVDWILVELRSSQNPSQVISRRAGLLRNDGRIMETNGSLGITFNNVLYGSYYIAVFHRNHLAIMSSVPVLFAPDNTLYDFTTVQSKAYGQNAMTEVTTGVFGMWAGDGDGNGNINLNDRDNVWSAQNGTLGYLNGDFNLDSGVTIKDINDFWNLDNGKSTQVP